MPSRRRGAGSAPLAAPLRHRRNGPRATPRVPERTRRRSRSSDAGVYLITKPLLPDSDLAVPSNTAHRARMLGDEPMSNDLTEYFAGTKLYGDDFSAKDIEAWFKDETDAYAELGAKDRSTYHYAYTALNEHHGYRFLPPGPIERARPGQRLRRRVPSHRRPAAADHDPRSVRFVLDGPRRRRPVPVRETADQWRHAVRPRDLRSHHVLRHAPPHRQHFSRHGRLAP